MKSPLALLAAVAVLGTTLAATEHFALAQPAKGAAAAFERVREVMTSRFKDTKLAGDPDKDFATLLIAHHEDLIFLAKTQLEYGGDRQMRQLAQKILDEQQKQIAEVKEWQVRSRQADYKAQPDQPPPGSGPLDQKAQAAGPAAPATAPAQSAQAAAPTSPATAPAQTAQAAAPAAAAAPATPAPSAPAALSAANLPMVPATVEKVDAGQGKITLDHGPIPNLNMDAMTMVFRAGDPTMLKSVRQGDKVQFQADRVNGQITVTKIQKGR
jgi:Cu/Ag efflux protein CusF